MTCPHIRLGVAAAVAALAVSACYSGGRAARDVNVAWRGHARAELEVELGRPEVVQPQPDGRTLLRWIHRGQTVVALPSGSFDLRVTPNSVDLRAEARPAVVRNVEYDLAAALVDERGVVLDFDAAWLVAGIPSGLNVRTGLIMGLHGGMSVLDDAGDPLPSVGAYIGGMLGPRLALLGAYEFVNGRGPDEASGRVDDRDHVHGHAWALALQFWPWSRLALRAGPAMVLDTDPGPGQAELAPGGIGSVSFAVVRAGSFVLDLRIDAAVSTVSAFAAVGLGVNVN